MRTHVFRWSFVSISAADPTSLEDCGHKDNLSNAVVTGSVERGASCANDKEAKPQHHYVLDYNIGLIISHVLPHATTDNTHTKRNNRLRKQHNTRDTTNKYLCIMLYVGFGLCTAINYSRRLMLDPLGHFPLVG